MSKYRTFSAFISIALIAGLFGGLIGSHITLSQLPVLGEPAKASDSVESAKVAYIEESSIINTVEKVSPSVVSIVITKDLPLYRQGVRNFGFNDFFNDSFPDFGMPFRELDRDENGNVKKETREIGGGSGFIISQDGLVVTNRHVVDDDEANYTVVTSDGDEFEADVLAKDTLNDFAVLKIKDAKDMPVVELGDSGKLKIGQRVVAIGNALAEYQNTVTTGIVSAVGRNIVAGSMRSSENIRNLIQTDAAINPGNSGGPLVNLNGEVIGINTAIASGAEGIGFAIPINDVKSLIDNVQKNGKIVRPFLGVRFMMLDKAKAEELKIDVENGALLVGNEAEGEFAVVPGSPAEKAGLKIKDVILEVDGEKVTAEKPLHQVISEHNPGDSLKLKVWRSGNIKNVIVKLEESK